MNLLDMASFGASIATLWATAAAWGTYYAAFRSGVTDNHTGLRNTLAGLKSEMALISLWACGEPDDPGLRQAISVSQYRHDRPDWANPSRTIYSFDCPTVKSLTQSNFVGQLAPIVPAFVNLSYSITRVYDLYEECRNYVMARPDLFQEIVIATVTNQPISPGAEEYQEIVFNFNYRIHVELIGGEDSVDELCLYKSFRNAREALNTFEAHLKPESSPWWFWVFHILAIGFGVGGSAMVILEFAR